MTSVATDLDELNRWMLAHRMQGFWTQQMGGPGSHIKPYVWKWTDVHAGLMKAAELVPAAESGAASPRTIGLRNPEPSVPGTIAVQVHMVMPGERTRAPLSPGNEARFVI